MGRSGSLGEVQIPSVKETGMAIAGTLVTLYDGFAGFAILRIVRFLSMTVKRGRP
jgi:hypothetical protein